MEESIKKYFPGGVTAEKFETDMEIIGEGAFATVFKVTEKSTKVLRALKKIRFRKTVIQEVEIMRKLRHENIVAYVYSYWEEEYVFIVMEYLAYGNLYELYAYLKSKGKYMTKPQIVYILRGMLEGLRHMHDNHIIHIDMRAGNVLIGPGGEVKICDFGASQQLGPGNAKSNIYEVSTLEYTAPEVIRKVPYNYKPDVWSMGMTLFEMIHGVAPYAKKNRDDVTAALSARKPPRTCRLGKYGLITRSFYGQATRIKTDGWLSRPRVQDLAKHRLLRSKDKNPEVFSTMRPLIEAAIEKRKRERKDLGYEVFR